MNPVLTRREREAIVAWLREAQDKPTGLSPRQHEANRRFHQRVVLRLRRKLIL
jgi:hypothetical protein